MNEAWSIGVFFRMFSNAKSVLGETTAAAKAAEKSLQGHNDALGKAGDAATASGAKMRRFGEDVERSAVRAERARAVFGRMGEALKGIGKISGYAAIATAGVGIKGAANLQDSINQTALASKLGPGQMARFHNLAIQMSGATAQSVSESMGLLRTLATSGINDPKELAALAMPIARFADTQYLGKNHVAFDTSAAMAAKIAHLMGERTAGQLTPVLDQLYRMSNDMPDSLAQAANQLKQFAPLFKQAGVSDQTILNLQATLDRQGFGSGFGGSGLAQILNIVRAPSKKAFVAQKELGMIGADGFNRFYNKHTAAFDPVGFFQYINDQRKKANNKGEFDVLLSAAMQTQNSRRIGASLSSDGGIAQYHKVIEQQHGMANVREAQERLMGSLNSQTKLLVTNFQTLATELAFPWLDALTAPIKAFANALGGAALWVNTHQDQGKILGGLVGAGALVSGIGLARQVHGNFFGGAVDVAQKGLHGHFFAGSHMGGRRTVAEALTEGAEHGGERFLPGLGRAILDVLSLRGTRGLLGDVAGVIGRFGPVARMGSAIGGVSSSVMGRLGAAGGHVAGVFSHLAPVFERLAPAVARVAAFLGGLGARAIPVAGDILLLIDAVKFLGTHSKDIGKVLADVVHWIATIGMPTLKDAFVSGVKWIGSEILAALKGIASFVGGVFTGSVEKSIGNVIGSGIDAYKKEMRALDHDDRAHASPTGNGGGHKPSVHINHVSFVLPPGSSASHAEQILGHLSNTMHRAQRSGATGSTPGQPSVFRGAAVGSA